MKNNLLKRSLVYGTILLLIGLGVTSSISGYIGKMGDTSTEETPNNFPLNNDDYINAYWIFDTGSGNIAYDSSGHDYDGTIYGATWTTHTPSGSGYALDFDGANDYVDLDAHAEGLGFNKTDDLIFSFYFKSTANDKGMIYSASTGYGSNPEFHIHLDDGYLAFHLEVTNCGFELYTNNTYNNNEWHYVEIIYNGISCEPTVEIYVDGDLDVKITHWVCPFENDEFTRTKIGRRSHNSSNYFDGILDEIKIIKFPGGNKQESPEISGPTKGEPGIGYNYTFVTNDPEEDNIWLYIDWGDGEVEDWIGPYESGEEVVVGHTWEESGIYTIKAKSKDIWDDSSWECYMVELGNIPPENPRINGPKYGDIGELLEYTFNTTDHEGMDIFYWIDWGDGTNTGWLGPYESGEAITLNHSWDSGGDYEIMAKAKDIAEDESEWSSLTVRIGNQAPEAPDITGETQGVAGEEYEYTFSSTDPEGDYVYYYIDWGDDSPPVEWIGAHPSGVPIPVNHTFTSKGMYNISAKAKDIYDTEGDWGYLEVEMPKNKPFNFNSNLLSWLLERFPHMFSILRYY